MAAVTTPLVLSPRQLAVVQFLCLSGSCSSAGLRAATGGDGNANTMHALYRLGVVQLRVAGRRGGIWTLTTFGHETFCAHREDDALEGDRPDSGDDAGPLLDEEVPSMNDTTTVTPDPKPASTRRNRRGGQAAADAAKAAVPPIEDVDVTAPPAPKATLAPLFKELLTAVKTAVKDAKGKDVKTEEKAAYTRVSAHGKAVIYVNNPTTKAVRVEVPQAEGSGYDVLKVTTDQEFAPVLALVSARVALLQERAAAKAAK